MIDVVNLSKIYKDKKAADVAAVDGVTFSLPERGIVFILGKSGCGKSTLLNVLGGLDGFDGGDVIVDGKPLSGFSQKDCDIYRSEYVGFVFQENNLLDEYTVEANVALALSVNGINDSQRVKEALADVQLEEYGGRKPDRLSGGQKQRVAIARAIVKWPKLLLCDEPTGALDSGTGEAIFQLLKNISKNTLVVVVTHDRESAQLYGDRIIELKNGKIISDSGNRKADITADEKGKKADISEGGKDCLFRRLCCCGGCKQPGAGKLYCGGKRNFFWSKADSRTCRCGGFSNCGWRGNTNGKAYKSKTCRRNVRQKKVE